MIPDPTTRAKRRRQMPLLQILYKQSASCISPITFPFSYSCSTLHAISALFLYQTGNLTSEASPTLILTHALNETLQADNLDYHCTEDAPSIRNVPQHNDCKHIINFLMPHTTDHTFHRIFFHGGQDIYHLPYQKQFRPALSRSTWSQDSQRRSHRGLPQGHQLLD